MGQLHDLFVSAGAHHIAAIFAGARAEVEDMVGGAHDVGIVLDNQNRVPEVAQIVQDLDQTVRVAAVQADRWLIEDVEGSHQTRTERGCKLNTLRLAAREGGSKAAESQVFQADFIKKAQAFLKFDEEPFGDSGLLR